jgi:hypothetical protein|tara:strand:- start:263 stop:661 length:399 start_codon:yes stop_codon:yes gene_type:complete
MIGKTRFLFLLFFLGVSIQTQGTTLNCSVKDGHGLSEIDMGSDYYQTWFEADYVFKIVDEDDEILQTVFYKDGTKSLETKFQIIDESFTEIWATRNIMSMIDSLLIDKRGKRATYSSQGASYVISFLLDCGD